MKLGADTMTGKKAKYTPWTIPESDWTPVLEGVTIDAEMRQELADAVKQFDSTELEERLRAYDTQVSNETMSKSVK